MYRLCFRILLNRAYKSGYYLFENKKLSLASDSMNSTIYYTLSMSGQNRWFNKTHAPPNIVIAGASFS